MKRIISFTLLAFLYAQESSASNNNNNNLLPSDENRLHSVLAEILPNVHVAILGDQVELTGTQQNIEQAIAKLHDFQGLRAVLLPVNNSKSLAAAKSKQVTNWDDFLDAAGVDTSINGLFNTKDASVIDQNGSLTVKTLTKPNQRMFQAYLDSLQDSSQFFVWARTNVPGFVVQHPEQTSIHYGLLSEFLHLNATVTPIDGAPEAIARFSTQNAVKSLVAAVSGNMALQQVADGQYRIQAISLGDNYDVRSSVLEIMVDRSGSMAGSPIRFVNSQLPVLVQQCQELLPDRQALTIRVKCFDDTADDIGTYVIRKGERLPHIPEIHTRGGTNLVLIEPLLKEEANERKLLLAFTDGEHTTSSVSLPNSIERMRALVRTGKFAMARLCKVGTTNSTFFDDVADIFGGQYSTEGSIQQFFTTITEQLKSLMRAKSPLVVQLAGQDVNVQWIPDDLPGVYSSNQVVSEGASVQFKGQKQNVEKPVVDQAALIAQLKSTLAALEQAQNQKSE